MGGGESHFFTHHAIMRGQLTSHPYNIGTERYMLAVRRPRLCFARKGDASCHSSHHHHPCPATPTRSCHGFMGHPAGSQMWYAFRRALRYPQYRKGNLDLRARTRRAQG